MYVKVFAQILDSSIADDHLTRWVFEDLLKLADKDGVVDMTLSAISRRTNVPLEIVTKGVEKLMEPDPTSRSLDEQGSRIVHIDPNRPWGWTIVNYLHYRNIRDGDDRKAYFRERKREQRSRSKNVLDNQGQSLNVTQAEAISIKQNHKAGGARAARSSPRPSTRTATDNDHDDGLKSAAIRVLAKLELSADRNSIDLVAQQIKFGAAKNGSIEHAASLILESCKTAAICHEEVTPFWIADGKFRKYQKSA